MRTVVHVLPHAGGGAETYIDALERMEGYRHERVLLSRSRTAAMAGPSIASRWPELMRRAHGADIVHSHGDVASVLALPVLRGSASVATTHGLHLLRRVGGQRGVVAREGVRAVVAAAGRVICTSEEERIELAAICGEQRARKLVVVHNGIDLPPRRPEGERVEVRRHLGIAEDEVMGLFLGQLEQRKDPLTAVAAARDVRRRGLPFTLVVAGDGPLAPETVAAGEEDVRVIGFRRDTDRLLAAADVFVMPSEREGLSFAVLEAMGHGLAMVVSDGPGNPEAVGDAGVVCPVGDSAAFADVLAALTQDPAERERLGAAARERVRTRFTVAGLVDRTRDVYESLGAGRLTAPARARAGARA
jgi:glycosyltransferase involved in cell wall biosynthesis